MAWKWFSKTLINLIFIGASIVGCSSSPKKSYTVNELEKRADEYLAVGDRFRLQGRPADALQYYRSAQNLYFKKWNPSKYTLSGMKETTVLVVMGELASAKARLDYFKNYSQSLNITEMYADIALSEAMLLYAYEKRNEATTLLDTWSKREDVALKSVSICYFIACGRHSSCQKILSQRFIASGTINHFRLFFRRTGKSEAAFFSALVTAEFLESNQEYEECLDLSHPSREHPSRRRGGYSTPRIFSALSRAATKLNKEELAAFYLRMHEEQLRTPLQ